MRKQLHPGARWLFRVQAFWAIVILVMIGVFFIFPIFATTTFVSTLSNADGSPNVGKFLLSFIGFLVVTLIVLLIILEVWVRMAYNRWFYEFTDSNLKQERGVIWKTYSNVPYERVQNVDINRGIIARMFGFSTLSIQTAGYSGAVRGRYGSAEGYIPAVGIDEAEAIRDFLMKKLSKKHQGL